MKQILFSLLFILLLIVESYAGSIKISADKLIYEDSKKVSKFIGNVVANYDNVTVNADNMTVFLSEKNEPSKILCIGNVKVEKDDIVSYSNSAEMDMLKDLIILKGNVKIWQNKNYLEGDEVYIYNKTKRVEVKNNDNKKVKIIFYPDEKGK